MSFFGGNYQMFGLSDPEIASVGRGLQRSQNERSKFTFDQGMRRLGQRSSARGVGSGGFTAGGVANLYDRVNMGNLAANAETSNLMARMRTDRTYAHQPGLGQTLLAGGMQMAGPIIGASLAGPSGAMAGRMLTDMGQQRRPTMYPGPRM